MRVGKNGWATERTMASIRRAIEFVLAESGVTAKSLAKFCGVSESTMHHVRRGRIISAAYAEKVLNKLLWLITEACKENGIRPVI